MTVRDKNVKQNKRDKKEYVRDMYVRQCHAMIKNREGSDCDMHFQAFKNFI